MEAGKRPGELGASELTEIVRFACAAAGLSTTRPGGISSVPEYEEVLAAMG
jgi:fructokinase